MTFNINSFVFLLCLSSISVSFVINLQLLVYSFHHKLINNLKLFNSSTIILFSCHLLTLMFDLHTPKIIISTFLFNVPFCINNSSNITCFVTGSMIFCLLIENIILYICHICNLYTCMHKIHIAQL